MQLYSSAFLTLMRDCVVMFQIYSQGSRRVVVNASQAHQNALYALPLLFMVSELPSSYKAVQSLLGALKCVWYKVAQCGMPLRCVRTRCTPLHRPSGYQRYYPLDLQSRTECPECLKMRLLLLTCFSCLLLHTSSTHSTCLRQHDFQGYVPVRATRENVI